MKTWKLTTKNTDGTDNVTSGLTEQEALTALADLMYGTWDDAPTVRAQDTRELAVAA